MAIYHAQDRGLRTDQPCPHLGLGFQPRLGDSKHLLFKALGVGHLLRQSELTDNMARICWGVSDGGRAGLGKPEPPREGVNPW